MHPERGLFGLGKYKEHPMVRFQGLAIHQAGHLLAWVHRQFDSQRMVPDMEFSFTRRLDVGQSEAKNQGDEREKIQ